MKRRMKIRGLKRPVLFLWCGLTLCGGMGLKPSVSAQGTPAQGVPAAIKYQAVLRDLEGEPMADRKDLAMRVTLRQGSAGGTILYQEEYADLSTNAFGLLQLEIGRGHVLTGTNLRDVEWENSPIYVQIELQSDDNGYTMMGTSELLSVPYALYAGNANVGFGLDDGVLPKYDVGAMGLVNSRIAELPDGAIRFQNDKNAYFFPTGRGRQGQSLTLIDEAGQLGWREGGGGGGVACPTCKDGYLVYFDQVAGEMKTSEMRQEPDGTLTATKGMVVQDVMEINATVTGTHNLRYNDLTAEHVWVGSDDNRGEAYQLEGGVTVDKVNKRLVFGGGGSVWVYKPGTATDTRDVVHTALDGKPVWVGVGTEDPQARFHLKDGSLLLSGAVGQMTGDPTLTAGNHLYWHSGQGALRMGRFDQDASGLWNGVNLGENSIALGTNAKAGKADNVAIGKGADAQGERTMVFGQNVVATGDTSLALGHNVLVSGKYAVGMGVGLQQDLTTADFSVAGSQSVGIGYQVRIMDKADESVAIGVENALRNNTTESVVIGKGNLAGPGAGHILLGSGNDINNPNEEGYDIVIGTKCLAEDCAANIVMGNDNASSESANSILLGSDLTNRGLSNGVFLGSELFSQNTGWVNSIAVNIGYGNNISLDNTDDAKSLIGPVLLGHNLSTDINQGVILGRHNDAPQHGNPDEIALVVGAGTDYNSPSNVLELYDNGNMYLTGNLVQASDLNLKTDIQPLNADFSVLQALQPVRYRFKADKKRQLQFGFIAQEVERYFPHLVSTGAKGLKSLNYIGLLPVLWQYTQRLEQTVETQATEIDRLQSEVDRMKADLEKIKTALNLE